MAAVIQLQEVELLNSNPALFTDPLVWRMKVAVAKPLQHCMTVSFVWVGSSRSADYDQQLDEFDVGPFQDGTCTFTLECDPPDPRRLDMSEILGMTVLQVFFKYGGTRFLSVGYFVQVAFFDQHLNQCPPAAVDLQCLGRYLVMNQPSIVTIPIVWDDEDP